MKNTNQIIHFFQMFKRSIVFILVVSCMFGGMAYAVSKVAITPKYRATTLLIGKNNNSDSNDINSANLQLMMVNTYKKLIQSTIVLKDVQEQLKKDTNQDFTIEELQSYISVDAEADSQIFSVYATYPNPQLAEKISQDVGEALLNNVGKLLGEGTHLAIISPAQTPVSPVSPNIKLNAILGFLMGMLICVGIIYFKSIQSTILDEFDVIDVELGLRNLGKVANQKDYNTQSTRENRLIVLKTIPEENQNEEIITRRSHFYKS